MTCPAFSGLRFASDRWGTWGDEGIYSLRLTEQGVPVTFGPMIVIQATTSSFAPSLPELAVAFENQGLGL